MVIWITGISGAGKTTLCEALVGLVKRRLPELVVLDGDAIRDVVSRDLGFAETDRVIQIKRIQRIAKLLSDQDLVVLVAALYAHPNLLEWNRQNFDDYFEIYVDAPLETVRRRDVKGLYAKFDAGEMREVVGLDIPWHAPNSPDLVIDATAGATPSELARRVAATIPRLAAAADL